MHLWYALHSKPNQESGLWQYICSQNVEAFYPHLRVKPVNPRSRRVRPYFPGYLFVHVDLQQMPLTIFRWAPHSLGLVCFDEEPASVPEAMIHAIQKHLEQLNAEGLYPTKCFRKGDRVRIEGGPFDGYQALFDAYLSGTDRVRVLLRFLQDQQMKLELPVAQIQLTSRC